MKKYSAGCPDARGDLGNNKEKALKQAASRKGMRCGGKGKLRQKNGKVEKCSSGDSPECAWRADQPDHDGQLSVAN